MQFYILALQGRISTRTSGPVDTQRLPRLRRLLRKLSAIGCRMLDRIVHVYTLHKLPGVQTMVTVQCSFAFWPGRVV